MSLSRDLPKKGLVFTALRGTGKDFALQQLMAVVDQPWNWHILCRTVEDYRHLLPLLAKVRRFAYADEIKVQDFNTVGYDAETHGDIICHEFNLVCRQVAEGKLHDDFTRKEKIAVYDILKARPFWRQRLIDRGMAGRAEDPNKWVNPTLDEIQTHFENSVTLDDSKVADFNVFIDECAPEHLDKAFDDAIHQATHVTSTREGKIEVYDLLLAGPYADYWRDRVSARVRMDSVETPVITDSRWPSEVSRVLERFPEFLSVRLWAPDVPVIDDPSENSMLKEITNYVFIRAPLTPFPTSEGVEPKTDWTPSELLTKFMVDYPQYWEHRTYVMA